MFRSDVLYVQLGLCPEGRSHPMDRQTPVKTLPSLAVGNKNAFQLNAKLPRAKNMLHSKQMSRDRGWGGSNVNKFVHEGLGSHVICGNSIASQAMGTCGTLCEQTDRQTDTRTHTRARGTLWAGGYKPK